MIRQKHVDYTIRVRTHGEICTIQEATPCLIFLASYKTNQCGLLIISVHGVLENIDTGAIEIFLRRTSGTNTVCFGYRPRCTHEFHI